jgi:hypothetical protein
MLVLKSLIHAQRGVGTMTIGGADGRRAASSLRTAGGTISAGKILRGLVRPRVGEN